MGCMSETMGGTPGSNRLDRRKARTRGALIAAAREMLASRDPAEVSIQEITEAADVGFGSFYNHFDSKAELFDAALAEAMEELGQLLDDVTRDIDDPAQVFATAIRITARLPKTHPQLAKIVLRTGLPYLTTEQGLTRPSHVDRAADELAVNLLRMFGVPRDEARAIAFAKLRSVTP